MNPAVPAPRTRSLAPSAAVLQAPPQWRTLDFISDLHLQASEPATFEAWQAYMQTTRADAVFILGDLFEVWVGDDVADLDQACSFEARCAQVLKSASQRLGLFFIHGNRDFLLGPAFATACGMTVLDDPTILDFGGERWLLSHGDELCLNDVDYLQFRAQVRSAPWQQDFLAKPLPERQAIARSLRLQSQAHQRSGASYADVDAHAACDWLQTAQAHTLIHGHTHQPADHALSNDFRRIVLSDWDATTTPPRAEVVRLQLESDVPAKSITAQRLAVTQAA